MVENQYKKPMPTSTKERTRTEKPRRSTGRVVPDERMPDGSVDLRPTAGYAGHEPVQYSDESDQQFAGRVAQFESARANARDIEAGGQDFAAKRQAMKARHEAELAGLDAQEKSNPKKHPPK